MIRRAVIRKRADFRHPAAAHYTLIAQQARFEARLVRWRAIGTRCARVTEAALFGFAIHVAVQIGRAAGWWHL